MRHVVTTVGRVGLVGPAALLVTALLASCGDGDFFETTVGAVEEGNAALVEGDPVAALAAYEEAAAGIPQSPGLDYDRGLALTDGGDHEESTQRLLRALETRDPVLKQKVYAALGAAYARWGLKLEREVPAQEPEGVQPDGATPPEDEAPSGADAALAQWRKAVEHLENALIRDPSDEESRRNLEVALLRVDPPCSARDREFEPNDQPEQAHLVEVAAEEAAPQSLPPGEQPPPQPDGVQDRMNWKRQVLSCPDDVDWFKVELERGDRLSVVVTAPEGSGQLSLSLWDARGQRRLRPSGDAEPMSALDLTAPSDGPVLIRIDNVDADEVDYQLAVTVRPACDKTEDRFEDNDRQAQGSLLTPGPLDGLKICPMDEDWYRFTLGPGESLFAYAELAPPPEDDDADADKVPAPEGPPPFELTVHDLAGTVVATGGAAERGRVATLFTPGEGTYAIRIRGEATLESRYSLMLKVIEPCPNGDDELEDNDTPEDASDLMQAAQKPDDAGQPGQPGMPPGMAPGAQGGGQPKPLFLRVCPGDVDWFHLQTTADKPFSVSAIFDHAKGDLSMALFDASGVEVLTESDASSAEVNGEGVMVPKTEEPEKRTIRIQGVNGAENFYLLKIQNPQGGGGDGQSDDQDENQDENEDKKDQDEQQPEDKKQDEQKPQPEEQKEEQRPLEEALDNLDRNPENLEARERKMSSPHANHAPDKDW